VKQHTGKSPAVPGWYDDPREPGQQAYWDGSSWTYVGPRPAAVAAAPAAHSWSGSPAWRPPALPTSRPVGVRLLITVALFLGYFVLVGFAPVPLSLLLPAEATQSGVLTLIMLALNIAFFAFLARKVSYRWFDAFLVLVPIYGLFWACRILWRVANLPHRDWRPRPFEDVSAP
jgi:hypothetical protein